MIKKTSNKLLLGGLLFILLLIVASALYINYSLSDDVQKFKQEEEQEAVSD